METLRVHLFKDSFGPFVQLLKEHELQFQMEQVRAFTPMASGGTIEVLKAAAATAPLAASVAAVLIAFIKARHGRKVIITTRDNVVIHAEGLTAAELQKVVDGARNITAIDTGKAAPLDTLPSP